MGGIKTFLECRTEVGGTNKDRIKAVDLYAAYRDFCILAGITPVGRRTFTWRVKEALRGQAIYGVYGFDGKSARAFGFMRLRA